MPVHENIVQNYANVEIFQIDDENEEDCLGWITILEKCETNVRNELKKKTWIWKKERKSRKDSKMDLII